MFYVKKLEWEGVNIFEQKSTGNQKWYTQRVNLEGIDA